MNFEECVYEGKLNLPLSDEEIDVKELIRFLQKNLSIKHLRFYGHKNLVETLRKMKQADLKSLDQLILYINAEEGKDAIPPLAEIGRSNVGLIIGIELMSDFSTSNIKVLVETKGFDHIQYLNLPHYAFTFNTPIDIEGVRILANSESVQGLKHLGLHLNGIGDDALKLLTQSQYLANLEYLDLYGCDITNAELLAQPSMKNLKHLNLKQNPLILTSIERLAQSQHMSQLESLRLKDCTIEGAEALSQMANLKRLTIHFDWNGFRQISAPSVVEKLVERKFDYLKIGNIAVKSGTVEAYDVYVYKDFCRLIMDVQSARETHTMLDAHTVTQRVFDIAAQDFSKVIIKHIVDRPNKYHFLVNSRNADENSLLLFYNNSPEMKKFLFSRGMIPDPKGEGNREAEGEVDVRLQEIARNPASVHFKEPIEKMKFFTRKLVKRFGINHERTKQAADSYVSDLSKLNTLHQSDKIRVRLFPLTQDDKKDIEDFPGSGLKGSTDKKAFIKFIFRRAKEVSNAVYLKKSQGQYEATHAEVYDDKDGAKITIPESIGYIKLLIDTSDPSLKERKDLLVDLAAENPELIEQKLPEIRSKLENNDISLEQITDRSRFHELLQDIDGDKVDSLFKQISDLDIKEIWREQAKIALLKRIFDASLAGGPNEILCSQGAWIRIIASLDQIDPEFTAEYSQHLGSVWEEIQRSGIDEAKGKEIAKSLAQELFKHVKKQPKLKEALNNLLLTEIDVTHPEQITLEQQQILAKINQELIQRYLDNNQIPKNADYQMIIHGFFGNKEINTLIQQDKLDEISKKIKNVNKQGQIARNREALKTEIKKLIEDSKDSDIDINTRNSEGETLLHLAARIGDKSLVSDLLSEGASFDIQNDQHLIPAGLSRVEEVSKLLTSVETAFSVASDGFSIILLKREINNSGDANAQVLVKAKNGDGSTLLSLVVSRKSSLLKVQEKRLEIIDLLADKGADINFKDARGNSLLYTAISNTDKEVVGALLKRGAVIDDATKLIVEEIKALPNPNKDIKVILEKLEKHALDKMYEDIKAISEKLEKCNEDIKVILKKLEKNNEDIKAILEKSEQHTLGKLFSNPCSSSTQKRKKRQPCDNSYLEEAWKEIKDFLQKKVESILELQAQLTRSESFVISVYKDIDLLVNNLRQGAVVDLEITIDQYKHLSAFAEGVLIRHNDLQKEAKQDIDNMKRSVSRIKTGAEIYHSNQDDFDSIFNSIEESLAGLSQKREDYRTGIDHLESTISNFDLSISRTEAALPIFKEVKIISIRVGSRLELLPRNSNNRALLSLDHQRDIEKLQQLKESIQRIQDVPHGVKSFLERKVEGVSQKAAQLGSCLQSGGEGRRRREVGSCRLNANEYIERLRELPIEEQIRVTEANAIDFIGSAHEVGQAEKARNLLRSETMTVAQKSYKMDELFKDPNEERILVVSEDMSQFADTKSSKTKQGLMNAAGRILFIRGAHGTVVSCIKQEGSATISTKDCAFSAGEMVLSFLSQSVEKGMLEITPKVVKSAASVAGKVPGTLGKNLKFAIQEVGAGVVANGVAGGITSVFDIADFAESANTLKNCLRERKEGEEPCSDKEIRDSAAGMTFSGLAVSSEIILTTLSKPGAGTIVGVILMVSQAVYSGISNIIEYKKYGTTHDENWRIFWHTVGLKPIPQDVQYLAAKKEIVNQLAEEVWEHLQNSTNVAAIAMGLGDVDFTTKVIGRTVTKVYPRSKTSEEIKGRGCISSDSDSILHATLCENIMGKIPHILPGHASIEMDKTSADTTRLSRFTPQPPSSNAKVLCAPRFSTHGAKNIYNRYIGYENERYEYDDEGNFLPVFESQPTAIYPCDNAIVIADETRMADDNENYTVLFLLDNVKNGTVIGSMWKNDFLVDGGSAQIFGGNNTENTFALRNETFLGKVSGGENSTNILNLSKLMSQRILYNTSDGSVFLYDQQISKAPNFIAQLINWFIGRQGQQEGIYCNDNQEMFVNTGGG